jgi:undecaprenyl diphosphate synthase
VTSTPILEVKGQGAAHLAINRVECHELTCAPGLFAQKVADVELSGDLVTQVDFAKCLYTLYFSGPELVICISGETHTSNFVRWQVADAEYKFTPKLWPYFIEEKLVAILVCFGQRGQSFGGVAVG